MSRQQYRLPNGRLNALGLHYIAFTIRPPAFSRPRYEGWPQRLVMWFYRSIVPWVVTVCIVAGVGGLRPIPRHGGRRWLTGSLWRDELCSGPTNSAVSTDTATMVHVNRCDHEQTSCLKIQYAAPYTSGINSPPNFVSPVRYCLLHVHLLSHMVVRLHCHHFHHVSPVLSFTLNLRLGSLVNPFHHRSLHYLPDWLYGLSAHLTFIFCSTAGSVCTVC